MTDPLQIYDPRERALVRLADAAIRPLAWRRPRRSRHEVTRVLLLRLERIGDLLMTLDAIAEARATWPTARIDLAVGSWNEPLARLIPEITAVDVADVPWLARDRGGDGWPALVSKARTWRRQAYDVVINFEADIRTNFLAWITGAPSRVGYATGGGGAFLTDALPYPASTHVSTNAVALVRRAAGVDRELAAETATTTETAPQRIAPRSRLRLADDVTREARRRLAPAARPLVGIHTSGGRESKQWHVDRFAAVARTLARSRGATIVLTGSAADRPLVDRVRADLGDVRTIDACGALDLPALAALLAELDVLVTGDTGPMHLAAAMGTPIVALFGPSNPVRYGPRARAEAILRVDLPCSPCGQVRLPPERCRGHVPECLDRISVQDVVSAAERLLDDATGSPMSARQANAGDAARPRS